MAAPKMAKISTKNTPNKRYGGEDTRTPAQAQNVKVRAVQKVKAKAKARGGATRANAGKPKATGRKTYLT